MLSQSPGIDNIKVEILKYLSKFIVKSLNHLMNLTFDTGVCPNLFKQTIVVTIYKKRKFINNIFF